MTAPPRLSGRGRREARNPLVAEAEAASIPLLRPESARDPAFLDALRTLGPDLAVVVSYGQILSAAFLELPRLGCINLHASLLPRWRGASPVQAALLAGDAHTGVSLQRVVERLDAGPVLAARTVPIGARETAPALSARLSQTGAELLAGFLDETGEGPLPGGSPQDEARVTTCRRLRPEDGNLDWAASAEAIDRRVRAMSGWPWARAHLPDRTPLRVTAGRPLPDRQHGAEAGRILSLDDGLEVACGTGVFRIESLQRPGKRELPAAEFARGARLGPGQILLGGRLPEEPK